MPRASTGSVESYAWRDGRTITWRLRFRAHGRRWRIDLGTNHGGWGPERARVELERVMAQVERGTWEPPVKTPASAADPEQETFHVFASRWWVEKRATLTPNARADYEWRLRHLLAHFARMPVAGITRRDVDQYRAAKVAERDRPLTGGRRRALGNRSVNMTLELLAQVLDVAVEWELLDANPARGRRRRLPAERPRRTFLEPRMVVDLLDAAGAWEAGLPEHQRYGRRALLAMLALAGPRIGELCAADRGDLDLANGRWRIPAAKTPAGERDVDLTLALRDELLEHVATMDRLGRSTGPTSPLFPTRTGGRQNPSNVRTRLLGGATARANEARAARGEPALPRVTPHTLRRTFASLALAAGRDPRWLMGQIGHTDARLTLGVYAQVLGRHVDGELVWALMRFGDEPEGLTPRAAVHARG